MVSSEESLTFSAGAVFAASTISPAASTVCVPSVGVVSSCVCAPVVPSVPVVGSAFFCASKVAL